MFCLSAGDDRQFPQRSVTSSVEIMTSIMMQLRLLMMMMLMMMMTQLKRTEARINATEGLAYMRAQWFNPKFTRLSMEPDDRYYFEQVFRV